MDPAPQPFAGQGRRDRRSQDFITSPRNAPALPYQNHNGPMPVPQRAAPMNNGGQQSKSPTGSKNTSHVPCKFYRLGTCQAGKACPFLHSDAVTPCKYFQKGNCKFGLKCANDHITADGRRVNKPGGYMMGPGPVNMGGRVMPPPPVQAPSLLTMQQDQFAQPQPIPGAQPDYMNRDMWRTDGDPAFGSLPKSNFGSPQADSHFLMSPSIRGIGLTAKDAQLPASFDSQGISKYAREGPIAASVPSRFGLDSSSPPASVPYQSSALRNLHSSAFGDEKTNGILGGPSSPPNVEFMERKMLHSERYASRSTRMLSASVGARIPLGRNDEEWDENPVFEEDLVPNSLQELLTPMEKIRRYSRNEDDGRPSLSGLGTPVDGSKVGSPSMGASPSRFTAFWGTRKLEGHDASPFGPVGSPLRNSGLHPGASPSLRATMNARPLSGDLNPISSPPRQASMSMISQQLQRTKLTDRVTESQGSSSPLLHPGISRVASGSSVGSSPAGRLDRAVSSSSVNREKIDEEPEEGLFSMDEVRPDDGGPITAGRDSNPFSKRLSGNAWANGSPFGSNKGNATLGPIGGHRTSTALNGRPNGP